MFIQLVNARESVISEPSSNITLFFHTQKGLQGYMYIHTYTARNKMIGAASNGHKGFGNARRSMFPTWNETASIQVLISCAIPPPLGP
jgi:hypothetical protein